MLLWLALAPAEGRGESGRPVFFSQFNVHDWDVDYLAGRYDLVVWHNHPRSVAALPLLREKNPQFKALLYRELFCVQREETRLAETVGQYDWIMEHHPEWFQRDVHGDLVEVPDYPGRFMMDFGNAEWQTFWIEQTLKDARQGGWDGVFVDDALTSVRMHDLPPLKQYSTDTALQVAVYGFLRRAYGTFSAEGLLMIANVSNSYDYPGLFERWLGVTDGILEEHCSGGSWLWGPHVGDAQLRSMQSARRAGKWYLCLTYGDWDDQEAMGLSLAAYLMGAGDKAAWSYRPSDPEHAKDKLVDPGWSGDIGAPLGDARVAGGVWSRAFVGGTVYVNPTAKTRFVKHAGRPYKLTPRSYVIAWE